MGIASGRGWAAGPSCGLWEVLAPADPSSRPREPGPQGHTGIGVSGWGAADPGLAVPTDFTCSRCPLTSDIISDLREETEARAVPSM